MSYSSVGAAAGSSPARERKCQMTKAAGERKWRSRGPGGTASLSTFGRLPCLRLELKSETIKTLWEIDSVYGRPDSLVLTHSVFPSLEALIADRFSRLETPDGDRFHYYSIQFRLPQ